MKYRSSALATLPYGSGRASMRALYCLYCFFCSSDPVTSSIHFAAISLASFVELFQSFCEEAPRPPELFEICLSPSVEGIDLARRPLLRRDLLHVDEAALLAPDEQREDDALQRALEHLRHLLAHGTPFSYSVILATGT